VAISVFLETSKLSNIKVQRILDELEDPGKVLIRVPGESRSGICPFCAQYVYMAHDGSGRIVPLPVVGTHDWCVCQDIPETIFRLGTKQSLSDTFLIPEQYRFKIRQAKTGKVDRFEWLKYQTKRTLTRILGAQKVGFLKDLPVEKLYNARTQQPKKNVALQRVINRKRG